MTHRPRGGPRLDDLADADLWLLAFGPWCVESGLSALDAPLWHPRAATPRIADLWRSYEPTIREHWRRHPLHQRTTGWCDRPWVEERLWFVSEIEKTAHRLIQP